MWVKTEVCKLYASGVPTTIMHTTDGHMQTTIINKGIDFQYNFFVVHKQWTSIIRDARLRGYRY